MQELLNSGHSCECVLTASCLNSSTSAPRRTVTMTLYSAEERSPALNSCAVHSRQMYSSMCLTVTTQPSERPCLTSKFLGIFSSQCATAALHCRNLDQGLFNLSKSSKVFCISFSAASPHSLFLMRI